MERTFVMIKPDGMKKGLADEIKKRICAAGFKIAAERTFTFDDRLVREHYSHMVQKPFFPELAEFMTSSPVVGMIVEGKGAINGMRDLMGVTDPSFAAKGTIRKDFGTDKMLNVVHGSDSAAAAEQEIKRFFGGN